MTQLYKIVRYYHPTQQKEDEVIQQNLTLEEAQAHCQDPKTQEKGVYFDGYARQNEYEP